MELRSGFRFESSQQAALRRGAAVLVGAAQKQLDAYHNRPKGEMGKLASNMDSKKALEVKKRKVDHVAAELRALAECIGTKPRASSALFVDTTVAANGIPVTKLEKQRTDNSLVDGDFFPRLHRTPDYDVAGLSACEEAAEGAFVDDRRARYVAQAERRRLCGTGARRYEAEQATTTTFHVDFDNCGGGDGDVVRTFIEVIAGVNLVIGWDGAELPLREIDLLGHEWPAAAARCESLAIIVAIHSPLHTHT